MEYLNFQNPQTSLIAMFRSASYCEGEKLPRSSQLSIALTPRQKSDLLQYSKKKKQSTSCVIREILKEAGILKSDSNKEPSKPTWLNKL